MSEAEHDCENRTALAAIKESAARCRTPMIRQDYESYHFLRYNVIEKNGALNGVRTIVTLIPEQRIGIAVFANKQLTVFPEECAQSFWNACSAPRGRTCKSTCAPAAGMARARQAFRNASRSALIVSACVIGMPWKPL